MLDSYRAVLRHSHAIPVFGFGMLGRIPLAMNTIALVFLVSNIRDSFLLAGITSSCYTLANAIASPKIGKWADQRGVRKVLIPISFINLVSILIIVNVAQASTLALLLSATLFGATFPSYGSFTRARWSRSLTDKDELSTALSLESVFDEAAFILGPALAGLIFATLGPESPLLIGAVLMLVASFGIALTASRETYQSEVNQSSALILKTRGIPSLLTSLIGVGMLFGSNFVVLIAVAKDLGRESDGGLWVALYPVGSLVAGLIYGAISWKSSHSFRYSSALVMMTVSTCGFLVFTSPRAIPVLVVIAGITIAPTLIAANAHLKELVPIERLNESFALLGAAISIGITLGSTLSGFIVDEYDGRSGFIFMAIATALAALFSLPGLRENKGKRATEVN